VLKPPHSKRWRDCDAASSLAKRMECGAFTAAFGRMLRPRTQRQPSPGGKSGAEATALQMLARLRCGLKPREAPGVRRVHRRFRADAAATNPTPTFARGKSGAEATALQALARLRCGLKPREAHGGRRVHRRFRADAAATNPTPTFARREKRC